MSQFDDYIADWDRVRQDEKPMMICEFRKCGHAYGFIADQWSRETGPGVYDLQLADSSGVKHAALAVTKDPERFDALVSLLANRGNFTRSRFQLAIGRLLGYSSGSCAVFSESTIGLGCACELCGGPPNYTLGPETRGAARQLHDEHVRRTMYHA